MTDWPALRHAYGPADDIPGLFEQAVPDMRSPIWGELWGRLCHQGTVYPASFAALPVLLEIAGRWAPAERVMPLALASAIVSSADQLYGNVDPRVTHSSELTRLRTLTEETLHGFDFTNDSGTYVYMLQALLAFEGVAVWGEHLDGLNDEEYQVRCPECAAECFVAFGSYGAFTTQDEGYATGTDVGGLPLVPADPAELSGLGKRLHARVIADGQPDIARKLTYVFGRADCPACMARFRVDEAVVSGWSG